MALDIHPQLSSFFLAALRKRCIVVRGRQAGKLHQHVVEEEGQPYAFTFTFVAHGVHAVVPVAGTDERQPVFAKA